MGFGSLVLLVHTLRQLEEHILRRWDIPFLVQSLFNLLSLHKNQKLLPLWHQTLFMLLHNKSKC